LGLPSFVITVRMVRTERLISLSVNLILASKKRKESEKMEKDVEFVE